MASVDSNCDFLLAAALAAVLVSVSARAQEGTSIELEAERVETSDDGRITATGSPRILFGKSRLSADRIEIVEAERRIGARGDVRLTDGEGNTLRGEELEYDFSRRSGEVSPVEITSEESERARLGGDRLQADGNVYTIDNAYYTTCPVDMETWALVADHFEFDARKKVARADSAKLVLGGVPVLYLPWVSFSTESRQRKSGFLTPHLEKHGRHYELHTPYYFNLAPNYDATVDPALIPEGGLHFDTEFRYLQRKFSGAARIGFIESDGLYENRRRHSLHTSHSGVLEGGWRWGVDVERVSDDDYLSDFYGGQEQTSRRNLPARMFVEGELDRFRVYAEAEFLDHLRDDTVPPYDQVPRVVVEYEERLAHLDVASRTEVVNFRTGETGKVEGVRVHETATVSRTFGSELRVIPTAGIDLAQYSLDNARDGSSPGYAVPHFTIDSMLMLRREDSLFGRDVEQFLEPRILYGYAPERSFNGHPVFDTAVADANYTTLFDRRRFSGGDRISNANFLSYGVTSSVWDIDEAREVLLLHLAQRVNFDDPDVALEEEEIGKNKYSNVYLSMEAAPTRSLQSALRLSWNPELSRAELIEVEGRFKGGNSLEINAAFFKTREEDGGTDSDLRIEALLPFSSHVESLMRADYSLEENHLSKGIVGFRVAGECQCWRMSAVAERYVESDGVNETGFHIRLELIGLAGVGSSRYEEQRSEIRNLW